MYNSLFTGNELHSMKKQCVEIVTQLAIKTAKPRRKANIKTLLIARKNLD